MVTSFPERFAAPASAPGAATPSDFRRPRRWRWLPRHPAPHRSAAQQRAGRFRSVAPAARPPCRPGTHSLSGPRRCPRSMTPGTAAAPAPGCWPRLLRPAADGGALRKLRRESRGSGSAQGYGSSGKRQQAGLLCPPPHCRVRPAMSTGHITSRYTPCQGVGFHGRITQGYVQ